jgi:hypothetical protein
MKFARVLMLSIFASGSALASQLPNPLVTYTFSNMTVTPSARTGRTCRIFDSEVEKRVTLGGNPPQTTKVKTAYTADVKDAAQLRSLVAEAAKGKIIKQPVGKRGAPVGGAKEQYLGVQTSGAGGAPIPTILLTLGIDPKEVNTSKAAKTLIQFADFNCKKQ